MAQTRHASKTTPSRRVATHVSSPPVSPTTVVRAYCDGGLIRSNPSLLGGTWAFVLVGPTNNLLREESGVVSYAELGQPVTNNYTELLAFVLMMEVLPDGWNGHAYSDSKITIGRVTNPKAKFAGIPESLIQRTKAQRSRLGDFPVTLLDGHPTQKHLAVGIGKRGYPTSEWNVRCDKACGAQASAWLLYHEGKPS